MQSYFLLLLLIVSGLTYAKGNYPDEIKVGETKLVKNGEGMREYSSIIGKINIYRAALYLEKKETNPETILNSDGIKVFKMSYVYDVSKKKVIKAWNESFEKNCGKCEALKAEIDKFIAAEKDCASGTRRTMDFLKDKLVIYHNKDTLFESTNKEFAKLILSTWLGAHPPTEAIKKSLLGL